MSPAQPGILTADNDGWKNPDGTSPPSYPYVDDAYRVLEIRSGAVVTMGNDLTITGGGQKGDVLYGAGVFVHDNGLANPFIMNGGTITGNKTYTTAISGTGAGVQIRNGSAFIMNGGTISDNTAYRTGGVAIYYSSTFTMNGGNITNNESDITGAGVRVLYLSSFTLNGGVISANKVNFGSNGGVYFGGTGASHFIMNGGTISGNTSLIGGGVFLESDNTFVMNGGTISDNTGGEYGGGVLLSSAASFTMKGGTISGNTAIAGGGGVAVLGGTFIKTPAEGSETSGIIYGNNGGADSNTATSAATLLRNDLGHAVYIAPEAGGPKTRETTVLPDQHLDSGAPDGWTD
jgi:hypothetical protein